MIAIPDCPYCGEPLDGPIVNGLHEYCNERLHEELAEWEDRMKYSGVLNWQDSEGHTGTIGDFRDIEAPSKDKAEQLVLDEYWDHRLDSACCAPVIIFDQ